MSFFRRKPSQPQASPVALVVGLGNPGSQYKGTRHNVGFEVVEVLAHEAETPFKTTLHQALVCFPLIAGKQVCLVKPLTYMNLSGNSVGALAKKFGIKPESILVIADDLDLPVGKVRLRAKGSAGGHNGHKSIIQSLGTQDYPRLKIGIGKGGETIDHVLSRFTPPERTEINEAVRKSREVVEVWIEGGIEKAMIIANSTPGQKEEDSQPDSDEKPRP
ncbi:MAG: aminoacyl-tRNA hydrolase [Fimbriimonadaceae bacterium]|nr:aminoacyl-tRNA hydrolase [Fimbriimonadaceae bacterium]